MKKLTLFFEKILCAWALDLNKTTPASIKKLLFFEIDRSIITKFVTCLQTEAKQTTGATQTQTSGSLLSDNSYDPDPLFQHILGQFKSFYALHPTNHVVKYNMFHQKVVQNRNKFKITRYFAQKC